MHEKACFDSDDGDGVFDHSEDWQQDRRTPAGMQPLPVGALTRVPRDATSFSAVLESKTGGPGDAGA